MVERRSRPHAVLFACGLNAVRSPMAAGLFQQLFGKTIYVASAGVQTIGSPRTLKLVFTRIGQPVSASNRFISR